MKKAVFAVVAFLLSTFLFAVFSPVQALAPYRTEDVVRRMCEKIFRGKDFEYAAHFDEEFRKAIPEAQLKEALGLAVEAAGYCSSTEIVTQTSEKSTVYFNTLFGNRIHVELAHSEDGMVTLFILKNVDLSGVRLSTWNDVNRWIQQWPGQVSMTIARLDSQPVELGSRAPQPIASAFKLYVLRALDEEIKLGKRKWTDVHPIRNDWKSLPSGVMQDYPPGRSVSLRQYAEAMIQLSDNTATDHLIRILGREEIEKALVLGQHQRPEWNIPFLRTDELFKLKWGAPVSWTDRYLRSPLNEKRRILEQEISQVRLSQVGTNGNSMASPTWIRHVEWFATPSDMCRVMRSMLVNQDPTTLRALALNTPFVEAGTDRYWIYAGFKGGSEPGVLTATYLLMDRFNRWSCMSVAWSNDKRIVNQWLFWDLVQKSLGLL